MKKFFMVTGKMVIVLMAAISFTAFFSSITGCASQPEINTLANSRDNVVKYQAEMKQDEAAVIECGPKGCPGLKVTINRPRAPIIVPEVIGTNNVIKSAILPVASTVTSLGMTAGAVLGLKAFAENMGTDNTNTRYTTAINGDDNKYEATSNITNTDSHDISGDNRSTNDSYNPDSHDAVSEPTIVTPPKPVIVPPSDVIIVE